jgi:hypothetical protein
LYLWNCLKMCDAMVSSCPTFLDNNKGSGAATTMTSHVKKGQNSRANVVAMLEKATT